MRRFFFPAVACALVALLAGGAWYFLGDSRTADNARQMREAARQLADVDIKAGVDVDLSLKEITLSQGEAGRQTWRLTAQRARYLQAAGQVELDSPRVAYYFKEGEGNMTVTAPQGLVEQESKHARLWPTIEALYLDNVIHADEMVYDGTVAVLTPVGAMWLWTATSFRATPR